MTDRFEEMVKEAEKEAEQKKFSEQVQSSLSDYAMIAIHGGSLSENITLADEAIHEIRRGLVAGADVDYLQFSGANFPRQVIDGAHERGAYIGALMVLFSCITNAAEHGKEPLAMVKVTDFSQRALTDKELKPYLKNHQYKGVFTNIKMEDFTGRYIFSRIAKFFEKSDPRDTWKQVLAYNEEYKKNRNFHFWPLIYARSPFIQYVINS